MSLNSEDIKALRLWVADAKPYNGGLLLTQGCAVHLSSTFDWGVEINLLGEKGMIIHSELYEVIKTRIMEIETNRGERLIKQFLKEVE